MIARNVGQHRYSGLVGLLTAICLLLVGEPVRAQRPGAPASVIRQAAPPAPVAPAPVAPAPVAPAAAALPPVATPAAPVTDADPAMPVAPAAAPAAPAPTPAAPTPAPAGALPVPATPPAVVNPPGAASLPGAPVRTAPAGLPGGRALPAASAIRQEATPTDNSSGSGGKLKFSQAPLEMLLDDYAEKTGRTLLLAPGLPKANITLRSQDELTLDEYLKAEETVLNMNGVALVRVDDKFLKVVPNKDVIKEGQKILERQRTSVTDATGGTHTVELPLNETGEVASQMILLKHIDVNEANKAIEPLKHPYATVSMFERINSILVTDSAENINRICQVLRYLDQPSEAREETQIMPILHAKASEIKQKLEELIAESQKDEGKTEKVTGTKDAGSPGVVQSRTIPGVIRPTTTPAPSSPSSKPASPEMEAQIVAEAERGIIRGKVLIVADDRTNLLIFITRRENMKFFEKIVKALDVETNPDVVVKVIRLEYAESKVIAGMLNELIGAASPKTDSKSATPGAAAGAGGEEGRSTGLRDYVERRETAAAATRAGTQRSEAQSKLGQLSAENIKILADERTNALVIMASPNDAKTIEQIVKDMDMTLAQVLIEAVILEIELGDKLQSGVDWVQRSMVAYNEKGDGRRTPLFSFAGGGGGGGQTKPVDATTLGRPSLGGGLTYYFTQFDLNMDAVLTMSANDNRTRILSSPVIVTHDNTEASIDSSEERYFYKGQRYVGGGYNQGGGGVYEPDVERRKVGIKLKVKPHINDKKLVVMEIEQNVEQLSAGQEIDGQMWPTVLSREFKASIAVQNKETIVLGGLVKTQKDDSNSGIPILRKIPILGWLFRSTQKGNSRSEVVVFITPYVMDSQAAATEESLRRKKALDDDMLWKESWSGSKLTQDNPELLAPEQAPVREMPPAAAPVAAPAVAPVVAPVAAPVAASAAVPTVVPATSPVPVIADAVPELTPAGTNRPAAGAATAR